MEKVIKKDSITENAVVGLYLIVLKSMFRMGKSNQPQARTEKKVINNYTMRPFLVCWALIFSVVFTLLTMVMGQLSTMQMVMAGVVAGTLAMILGVPIPVNIKR